MTQHDHRNAATQFVDTANFAARDKNARCLSYGVLRKLAGLPRDLFTDYWRDVLGPLCARLPSVGYYVQHHFSQDHRANLWPLPDGIDRMDVVLDGAAEIGFADIDGLNRYAEASPVLFGDVVHLFEHIVAYNLPRGSRTLVDREADGIPNGPDRLYRLHLLLNGGSGDGFRPWLSEWARHWHPRRRCGSCACICRNRTTTRTRRRPRPMAIIRSVTNARTSGSSRSVSRARSQHENSAKAKPIAQPSWTSAGISARSAHSW
jgi:hypothetical protein